MDLETIMALGQKVVSKRDSSSNSNVMPELNGPGFLCCRFAVNHHILHRSFQKRHHLSSRLRWPNTDRVNTAEDLLEDNKWRCWFCTVTQFPASVGLPWQSPLPPACVLGFDETPLPYKPRARTLTLKKTHGRIHCKSDRRQITATPIVAMDGDAVMVQLSSSGGVRVRNVSQRLHLSNLTNGL